jgi:hypothetical protein
MDETQTHTQSGRGRPLEERNSIMLPQYPSVYSHNTHHTTRLPGVLWKPGRRLWSCNCASLKSCCTCMPTPRKNARRVIIFRLFRRRLSVGMSRVLLFFFWLLLYAHRHRSILGAAGHIILILTPANQLMVMGLKKYGHCPIQVLNQGPFDHWPNALTTCANRAQSVFHKMTVSQWERLARRCIFWPAGSVAAGIDYL